MYWSHAHVFLRLAYGMMQEQGSLGAGMKHKFFNKRMVGGLSVGTSTKQAQAALSARLKAVSKLMDSYLAEVARDSKLPLDKFHSLAEAVPVSARVSDDGLYRAIDTYLKVRNLSEPLWVYLHGSGRSSS